MMNAQEAPSKWNTPGAGNPIIPGYFADPTIRKFGDTYYIYATTDGTGNGYGPAQVWLSKDFVNWRNVILNWPTTEVVWAPDVVKQPDGKYRYYYCTPCVVLAGESDNPTGPWTNILGKSDEVLVEDRFIKNCITLDPQLFIDDDGKQYLYFGTWGIYNGFGCGVARLAPDGKSFDKKQLIPNTQVKDFFEAPYVFKKNGVYYFTYSSGSCHDDTYRVQYAISTTGPMGPYEYKGCILKTTGDGTVHGPGHHSILVDGDDYYIVYHRHNIPNSIHGFNRQVCIDKMEFDSDGSIKVIKPTHDGLIPASLVAKAKKNTAKNLAYGAKTTSSSDYSEWFKSDYAVDDNNATLWKPKNCNGDAWLQIDLGKETKFNQIWTQFEYATFFYQYKIETSIDGSTWSMYADRTSNTDQGSPMIDKGEAKARYVRITITDTQKNGHFGAIWNVKVFNESKKNDPSNALPSVDNIDYDAVNKGYPNLHKKDVELADRQATAAKGNKIIDINADDYAQGKSITVKTIKNRQGGEFTGDKSVVVEIKKGKYAFFFNGQQSMTSDFSLPKTMTYNAPYTITAWTLNPQVGQIETVAEFTRSRNDLATIEFRQGKDRSNGLIAHNASFENSGAPEACAGGEGEWQHWTITYDGYMEKVYLNGELLQEKNTFLMIRPQDNITLGASMDGANKFSGYIHSLQFYDKCLTPEEVKQNHEEKSGTTDVIDFNGEFKASAKAVTPTLAEVAVTDNEGNRIESGLLSFSYAMSSAKGTDSGLAYSTPSNSSSVFMTTDGKPKQKCYVKITDDSGKFNKTLSVDLSLDKKLFSQFEAKEKSAVDYTKSSGSWDGFAYGSAIDGGIKASYDGGVITLESEKTNFNNDKSVNGPVLYKEVTGDFVMQAKVESLDGQDRRSTPAYNEGGIIVMDDSGEHGQSLVQLGVFPNYNCGNMLTTVSRWGRPQFPASNGWNYDPYLQIERVGDMFYARTSADGKNWTDCAGSPVSMPQMKGKAVKVGLYQTTYSDNHSWAKFKDFNIWQKK